MRTYIKVLNELEKCINGKLNEENINLFFNLIHEFKTDFKKGISTKFLRELIKNKSQKTKTNRINYFIKKSKLNIEKSLRHNFQEWVLNKCVVDIIEYTYDEKFRIKEHENAFIKNIRKQDVGSLSYSNNSELLHFVKI